MFSTPLFWRVFVLNAVVFLAGVGGLALTPATVSWPMHPAELLDLTVGLGLLLGLNTLLLRVALAPLGRLTDLMGTVDLLRPGQRLPERGNGELAPLVHAFNAMLERLEAERAASSAHALSAQEAERKRIARELHDEIGQRLTFVLIELSRATARAPEPERRLLQQVLESARESLSDVRRLAQQLRPDVLEDLGLSAALSALISEFSAYSGLPVRSRLGSPSDLSEQAEVAVYRIAQESLTNVARHARARNVEVRLDGSDGRGLRLVVSDDGCGLIGGEGRGIRGMRERALLAGGDLDITSTPGAGTRVSLHIPAGHFETRESADAADTHSPGR